MGDTKTNWKAYFVFSRKERTGIIIVLVGIVLVILLPEYYRLRKTEPIVITPLVAGTSNTVEEKGKFNSNKDPHYEASNDYKNDPAPVVKLFYFDPNTIDEEGWKKLGLRDKTIRTILNYRSKGGKFRQAEDLRKIYGLRTDEADRLIPYIRIASQQQYYNSSKQASYAYSSPDKKTYTPTVIDINTSDVYAWRSLPSMPTSLAYRIINFREKIGGFLEVEEVKQTYGMTDSIWLFIQPYLKTQPSTIPRININTATQFQLSMHPIFSKDVAKAIVIYRNQNGMYSSPEDLKKIIFINEELFKKLEPFITTQ
jgi:competence protein ComEA